MPGFAAQSCSHAVYLIRLAGLDPVGADCAAATNSATLDDPSVLIFNQQRWLTLHGDALCLGDTRTSSFAFRCAHAHGSKTFWPRHWLSVSAWPAP